MRKSGREGEGGDPRVDEGLLPPYAWWKGGGHGLLLGHRGVGDAIIHLSSGRKLVGLGCGKARQKGAPSLPPLPDFQPVLLWERYGTAGKRLSEAFVSIFRGARQAVDTGMLIALAQAAPCSLAQTAASCSSLCFHAGPEGFLTRGCGCVQSN